MNLSDGYTFEELLNPEATRTKPEVRIANALRHWRFMRHDRESSPVHLKELANEDVERSFRRHRAVVRELTRVVVDNTK